MNYTKHTVPFPSCSEPTHLDPLQECSIILFDTCSILEDTFVPYLRSLIPLLNRSKQVLIPQAVMKEVHYLAHSVSSDCRPQAQRAERHLQSFAQSGFVHFVGDPAASEHADHYLIRYAATNCFDLKPLIVTQDGALLQDLDHLNQVTSRVGAPIFAGKLSPRGNLVQKQPSTPSTESSLHTVLRRYGLN